MPHSASEQSIDIETVQANYTSSAESRTNDCNSFTYKIVLTKSHNLWRNHMATN